MKFRSLGLAAICTVSLALPAWAHHSHVAYDLSKWYYMEGKVTQVQTMNPHSWIYMEVGEIKDEAGQVVKAARDEKGQPTVWALEAGSPAQIQRKGIKKGDVLPGDRIKVRCRPVRDGTNGCLLGFVTPMHGDKTRGADIELEWD